MARSYTSQPALDIIRIKPQRMRFDVVGSAIEGGRNLAGQSISIEMSGGGMVTASYENCWVQAREEHEYFNWLAARLNGSFRFINVPIFTDWMGPFPVVDGVPKPFVPFIPNPDGSLIQPGQDTRRATVTAVAAANAALNAGVISVTLAGAARPLRHSDWLSINHPDKGWRAYRYWSVISAPSGGQSNGTYQIAISPPLRQAISSGDQIDVARPRFVGKLAPGTTIPWEVEGFWQSRPTLQLVEAF